MDKLTRQCLRCFAALILITLTYVTLTTLVYPRDTNRQTRSTNAVAASAVLPQCATNLSGYFYPKGPLPAGLAIARVRVAVPPACAEGVMR